MGVQLNIKDPETVRLARTLAEQTGRTVTDTIRAALEQAIADRDADVARRVADIQSIVAEMHRSDPSLATLSSRELMDSIYDDDGLPA